MRMPKSNGMLTVEIAARGFGYGPRTEARCVWRHAVRLIEVDAVLLLEAESARHCAIDMALDPGRLTVSKDDWFAEVLELSQSPGDYVRQAIFSWRSVSVGLRGAGCALPDARLLVCRLTISHGRRS